MSTREERRAAAREGILAAAHRQVAEGGCASASVAAVASRAGVAAGTLYRHFPSHADLLAEVVRDALRGEHRLLAAAIEGLEPRDALEAWVRLGAERARAAPRLTTALRVEPVEPVVAAARRAERSTQQEALVTLLAAGARKGAWPPGDHALQAAAVSGALDAVLLGAHPAGDDALVALVLGAVGARRS